MVFSLLFKDIPLSTTANSVDLRMMHRELLFTGTAPVCHLAFSCNVVSRNTTDTSAVVGAIVDDVFANVTVATLVPSAGESAYGTSNPFDSFTEDVCSNLLTEFLQDDALNLENHADLLAKLPPEDCIESVQWAYSKCYWCSPEASSNPQYCTTYDQKPCDVPLDERKTKTKFLNEYYTTTDPLCLGFYDRHVKGPRPASMINCDLVDDAWAICDFCGDDVPYLGADTQVKQALLAWLPRIPACLSMLGASYMIRDVVKSKRTVYHGLMFAMAVFDFCTAAAWLFTTAPSPTEDDYLDFVYGKMGNETTCKVQAFFIQLGVTSVFYNAALCTYYWLVIVKGWTERRLQKRRILLLLHGPPLLVGFALAFGGLPVYTASEYACHLWYITPSDGKLRRVRVYLLFIAPVAASILYITIVLGLVYWKVSRQSRQSRRWIFGASGTAALQRRVFRQCIAYALAFYITWPLGALNYAFSFDMIVDRYGYTLFVSCLKPLQGFTNFLVYVRPRWDIYIERKRRNRIKAEQTNSASFSIRATNCTEGPSSANLAAWSCSMEPSVKIAADIAEHCDTTNDTTDSRVAGGRHMTRSLDACVEIADDAALNLGEKGGCCTEN